MNTLRAGILTIALVCAAGIGYALEADEIAVMIQHGVEETTIIEVVRMRPLSEPLTAAQVIVLSNAGASTRLLAFLTTRDAVSPEYSSQPATNTVVVEPAPATVVPQSVCPTPGYVVTPPVVAAPPVVVYRDYYPSYPRWSFSFGFSDYHRWGGRRGWGGHRPYRYHGRHRGGRRR